MDEEILKDNETNFPLEKNNSQNAGGLTENDKKMLNEHNMASVPVFATYNDQINFTNSQADRSVMDIES